MTNVPTTAEFAATHTASTMAPMSREERLVRLIAGATLANPWFDGIALFALRHWFFPMSRLWAAAREARGDVQKFTDAVPMPPRFEDRVRLGKALAQFEQARIAAYAIEAEWERAFFGAGHGADTTAPDAQREAVEGARITLRHAYNATRRHFRFMVNRDVPRVKTAISNPAEVAAIYGAPGKVDVARWTAAPDPMPPV